MSTIIQEPVLISENNINDIFERKIEVGAVIQFNLLQRIIEEFIKTRTWKVRVFIVIIYSRKESGFLRGAFCL